MIPQQTPDTIKPALATVASADGTLIAVERAGDGPPVVVISGGLNQRIMFTQLVDLLSTKFTVFNYDRRGRGDSGDGDPDEYTIDHEVDDLAAVLAAIGEPANVFGNCTGGIIAMHAAARGFPMEKLALYEPPYSVGGTKPVVAPDYLPRLKALIAAGRREEAIVMFQKEAVGNGDDFVEKIRNHPVWPLIEGLAHTLVYERVIVGDGSIPADVVRKVDRPTLLIEGGESPEWQRNACSELVGLLPRVEHLVLDGQGHMFPQHTGAPLLERFFLS
ncbi:alpha/beta hydrolase [Amycolatopsis sp. QT-25]|uniref:alpha/beta fold hydrolase n=1 Tax=Amycolatopsis sp. QT-25 TaxID=3034022 RepID=UPI0023EDB6D8|nr:alpha/beta hydrolase [Amycolatopsis sp. QT-25]WET76175.1 alpha/beta hydrolase [Amycolatopsis sp. QT-25]